MNETNHPARRLRHGDRPTEQLTFEDDAANKAAEEGEPTDAELAREVLLEELEGIANYWDCTEVEGVSGNIIDVGKDLREKFAALKFAAIAADRASRQVANKAEVDLSSLTRYSTGFAPGTMMINRTGGNWVSLLDVKTLLATPPATTGASTVLTDERINEAMLKYSTCISPCVYSLTSFDCEEDMRSFVREVAAQAGQVAVPGWTSVDESLPEFRHECTSSGCEVSDSLMVYGQNGFGTMGCGFGHARDDGTWATYEAEYDQLTVVKVTHWMPLPAAPSPAKESK